jgi:hypothetical protein
MQCELLGECMFQLLSLLLPLRLTACRFQSADPEDPWLQLEWGVECMF